MNKTDKELTTEIVIATINANPRMVYKKTATIDGIAPAINLESITNLITSVHETLKKLD